MQLAIGIMIHEITAAIALGTSFVKAGFTSCELFWILTVFTLITPTGIIIGMIIAEKSTALVDMIFFAISAGTFFYVACTEIIVNEFKNNKNMMWKMLSVTLGGLTIVCLWFIESEHHHHGPTGDHAHGATECPGGHGHGH